MRPARHRAQNLSITIPKNECAAALANAQPPRPQLTDEYPKHQGIEQLVEPLEISHNVYICGEISADALRSFDVVFNVAREVPCPLSSPVAVRCRSELENFGITCKTHQLGPRKVYYYATAWDHDPKLSEVLGPLTQEVSEQVNNNKRVLIHCKCGISRSATLVLAYVMQEYNMDYTSAYSYVKTRHPALSPNLSLVAKLLEWQTQIGL
ncbi:Tyrosine-protein phosphatase pmp1 [Wickerhamiella sorbophila]|uniref:protein-tyrosine-phosphatase n=1 Tax=Wickerhamiella sorbophila TaxID=45607 RepID=A0A2T0FLM4_9ASCO|nr:Tyrosine-protein phosphatase pmp1 [Wickerhamiella sorbophila]PRT55867.1 Tyrosine-protein phosphatase pmp1 [Wickerhamiella sorbophila]